VYVTLDLRKFIPRDKLELSFELTFTHTGQIFNDLMLWCLSSLKPLIATINQTLRRYIKCIIRIKGTNWLGAFVPWHPPNDYRRCSCKDKKNRIRFNCIGGGEAVGTRQKRRSFESAFSVPYTTFYTGSEFQDLAWQTMHYPTSFILLFSQLINTQLV
jgi:hypothetical protein